jgi:GMP synthase (glutamine-hydrolysing)
MPSRWGSQRHAEADPRQLEEWYVGHAVELTAAGISIPELRAATMDVAGKLQGQAGQIFDEWFRQVA